MTTTQEDLLISNLCVNRLAICTQYLAFKLPQELTICLLSMGKVKLNQ